MFDIYDLMELAMREMSARLSEDCFTDDWQWNDTCFQFVIVYDNGAVSDPYRFCPDPDEAFYGSAVEQLMKWLDYRF